jgi:hypothetical protein
MPTVHQNGERRDSHYQIKLWLVTKPLINSSLVNRRVAGCLGYLLNATNVSP